MNRQKYTKKPIHHRLWVTNKESTNVTTRFENLSFDRFVINDNNSRIIYLAAQINSNLPINLSSQERKCILEDTLDFYLPDIDYLNFSVDQDSTWLIPRLKDSNYPSKRYIQKIKHSLLSNKVIIASPDFNPETYNLSEFHDLDNIFIDSFGFYCIEEGDNYLLFNKVTEKIIKLDSDLKYSSFHPCHPQSIDLMITNRCSNFCLFCCRDCTPDGKVAPLNKVKKCISDIQRMNVSEVLLGGGDLYTYPEFNELIEYLRVQKDKTDLVFNVALPLYSRNLYDYEVTNRVKDLISVCNNISFSTDYSKGVRDFIEKYKRLFDTNNILYDIGIIPEILYDNPTELSEVLDICKYFGIKVTLLGYKRVGRGEIDAISLRKVEEARKNKLDMLNILFDRKRPNYLIDRKFIELFPEIEGYISIDDSIIYEKYNSLAVDAVFEYMSKTLYSKEKIPLDIDGDIKNQIELNFPEMK